MDIESRDIITGLLTCEEAVGGKASTDLFCDITGQGPAQGLRQEILEVISPEQPAGWFPTGRSNKYDNAISVCCATTVGRSRLDMLKF